MKLAALIILGLAIMVVLSFLFLGSKSRRGAPLGLQDGRLAPVGARPNAVCSEDGTPARFAVEPLATTLSAAKAALIATGGEITVDSQGYVATQYRSKVFGFVDDVELRAQGEIVHIRSASREGYSDRGVNKARIAAIRAAL